MNVQSTNEIWCSEIDLLTRFHPDNKGYSYLSNSSGGSNEMRTVNIMNQVPPLTKNIEAEASPIKPCKSIGRGKKVLKEDDNFVARQIESSIGVSHRIESVFNVSTKSSSGSRVLDSVSRKKFGGLSSACTEKTNSLDDVPIDHEFKIFNMPSVSSFSKKYKNRIDGHSKASTVSIEESNEKSGEVHGGTKKNCAMSVSSLLTADTVPSHLQSLDSDVNEPDKEESEQGNKPLLSLRPFLKENKKVVRMNSNAAAEIVVQKAVLID